jgi:hypothetical protein
VYPPSDVSSREAGQNALRVFFRISDAWRLTEADEMRLLNVGRCELSEWRAGRLQRGLDKLTLERLSHVLGIYLALHLLLPIPERANAWIRRPNAAPLFGGESALQRMRGGQISDLFVVRQYLDAQCAGLT